MLTVREFIRDCYSLIDPHNPVIPLTANDLSLGVRVLNMLIKSFSANGLLISVAKEFRILIPPGTKEIITGSSAEFPTPDIPYRCAHANNCWLDLEGLTYPLVDITRSKYLQSYKYRELGALPLYFFTFQENKICRIRLYPGTSQHYHFNIRGKFQLPDFDVNGNMDEMPEYSYRWLELATAKDIALKSGRSEAWTDTLESSLKEARLEIEGVSEVDLSVNPPTSIGLVGAARVRAGI